MQMESGAEHYGIIQEFMPGHYAIVGENEFFGEQVMGMEGRITTNIREEDHGGFVCYWLKPGEYGVMLSTILVFYLFSAKRTLGLLNGIRNSRGVMAFVFTVALALLFTPHMYSLGVALGYILLAAGFYPSSLLEGQKPSHKEFATYQDFQDDIIQNYYL